MVYLNSYNVFLERVGRINYAPHPSRSFSSCFQIIGTRDKAQKPERRFVRKIFNWKILKNYSRCLCLWFNFAKFQNHWPILNSRSRDLLANIYLSETFNLSFCICKITKQRYFLKSTYFLKPYQCLYVYMFRYLSIEAIASMRLFHQTCKNV